MLLVPKTSRIKSADELWQQDRIQEVLITVPSNELITRAFQEGLNRLKVDWFSGIEVSSVGMVQTYVANGYGLGVTVHVPKMKYHSQVRLLRLEGFKPVTFGLLWQGGRSPVQDCLSKVAEQAARDLLAGDDADGLLVK